MIWATVEQLRAQWTAQQAAIPGVWPQLPESDAAVQVLIDSAARTLGAKVLRWPIVDDTDQAEDVKQRGHIIVAVAEVIRARLDAAQTQVALGGAGNVEVIAAGGEIAAGKLRVSGGSRSGGGARIGKAADLVPIEAVDAMAAADLIGGSAPSW